MEIAKIGNGFLLVDGQNSLTWRYCKDLAAVKNVLDLYLEVPEPPVEQHPGDEEIVLADDESHGDADGEDL